MTTHRSLNKLEYKAHMSIHNVAEVEIGSNDSHGSAYTRDRLGRSHKLFEGDGTSRIFKPAALAVAFFLSLTGAAQAIPENIQVSSDELEEKTFDERLGRHKPQEDFAFYKDDTKKVGFNENGDPNVAMRF